MRADLNEAGTAIGESTFLEYVEALRKLFVIEGLKSWSPNLRSKTAIRTKPTRYFADPSIAAAALGATPSALMSDLNTMGLIFETLCIRDLRVYADGLDGEMLHYRDKRDRECDAVNKPKQKKSAIGQALNQSELASLLSALDKLENKECPSKPRQNRSQRLIIHTQPWSEPSFQQECD